MRTKIFRLSLFGLSAFFLISLIPLNWYARRSALSLVRPAHLLPAAPDIDSILHNSISINFETTDGLLLRGEYLPSSNNAAVILLHGHAANRSQMEPDARLLAGNGFGVLLFDARNSGESEGDLTTLGLKEVIDVQAAYDFLIKQDDIDPKRIGVLGHSMGGSTAILAGAQIPELSAIVAQSTFTSLEDNVTNGVQNYLGLPPFPFAPLVLFWGQYESGMQIQQVSPIEQISQISPRPVLIVHGAQDQVIPVENAYRLFEAAKEPKQIYVLAEAEHCCLPQIGADQYKNKLLDFFEHYLLK